MLGIDVSKDTLACTLFDAQTQKPGALWADGAAPLPTPQQVWPDFSSRHRLIHPGRWNPLDATVY